MIKSGLGYIQYSTVNSPYMHPLYMHSLYIYTLQFGPNLGLSAKCTFYIYIYCKCTFKKILYSLLIKFLYYLNFRLILYRFICILFFIYARLCLVLRGCIYRELTVSQYIAIIVI